MGCKGSRVQISALRPISVIDAAGVLPARKILCPVIGAIVASVHGIVLRKGGGVPGL